MANESSSNGMSGIIIGMIAGLAIGAAAGMLLAPKKGSENREFLREKYEEMAKLVKEKMRKGESEEVAKAEMLGEITGTRH